MDLGTANSIVIYNDQVVIDEPSIVAVDRNNNKIIGHLIFTDEDIVLFPRPFVKSV